MKRAIVIGAGIAGPCAALALARAGIAATIYETYEPSASLAAGAWLTVAVNGLDAMRTIGVHEQVKAAGFASRAIELCSGTGRVLGTVPIGGTLPDGTVTHTLKRADLYRIVSEEARRRGIEIVHGKRFTGATITRGGRVVASFDDGDGVEGDVLIGADGLRSRVREVIDPGAPRPRYNGLLDVGGFTRSASVELAPGTYRMIFGHRCFFGITVSPSREIWWFANPARAEEPTREALASHDWRAHLIELASADRTPLAEVIAATEGSLIARSQYDVPRVPTWSRGPIVVIGDAAHAASPSSGQGASMAAEDAVELARCLRDVDDVPGALAAYESLRRARVERVVAHGARTGSAKTLGPVGRWARDLVMPWVLRMQSEEANERSLAWLFRHRIEWDAAVA
ncbi:FAD-dependent monooxygenase [Sandaracinus amylolyticus]|uniref:FAD-dependent monooxygenase n=1 Tax=Sandaracinus amylolyticus TaxID=927083 RepID=UPI001F2AC085|nr:FAD-dependent monooxygenase [Sandaracinus amylolyticus]UJR83236.1 Hypothetical protein I5071_53030 [Sandaracinus amylolyticus]